MGLKILYGVQGTGNGHITRAMAIGRVLKQFSELEVDWVITGNPNWALLDDNKYFIWRKGLTFGFRDGRIDYFRTAIENNIPRFISDVRQLDLSRYDLIISDFEPVVAWAAKINKRECIGIGHQYAFSYDVPIANKYNPGHLILKHFAPVTKKVGMHWHHFNQPILPPIVDLKISGTNESLKSKVLVYLPFENQDSVVAVLREILEFDFYIYGPLLKRETQGNVHTRSISKISFKDDLLNCHAIVCNTGFELISEALRIGKRILTKPLYKQIEQLSNAVALKQLGYAEVIDQLDAQAVRSFLNDDSPGKKIVYPDVAQILGAWIAKGCPGEVTDLATSAWGVSF